MTKTNYVGDGTEVHFPLDPDLTRATDHPIMPLLAHSEGSGSFVKNPMSVVAEGLPQSQQSYWINSALGVHRLGLTSPGSNMRSYQNIIYPVKSW